MKKEVKKYLGKFWFLLWKDDSLKGWIFATLFLFLFIKFIFFPILNLVTGTTLPLAIVESCSMYHDGNLLSDYNKWWNNHDEKYDEFEIDKNLFKNFIFRNGLNKGDILFVIGRNPAKLEIGDVIIFNGDGKAIIHRLVNIENNNGISTFSTIGDNNNGQLSAEKEISEEQIIGQAVFKIAPYFGWGKLIFFEPQRSTSEKGFCKEN